MKPLAVIVPSMNRPAQLARLAGSFRDTVAGIDGTDLVVVLDQPYRHLYTESIPWWVHVYAHPAAEAQPTTVKVNWAARKLMDGYRYLMFCGDDHTCGTPGWNNILLGAVEAMGGTGIVYPKTERLPDLPEVWVESSDLVRALGWLALPVVRHYFIDNGAKDIGQAIGRYAYVPEAVLPHHHWSMPAGMEPRAERDECYDRAVSWFPADKLAYWLWRDGPGLVQAAAAAQKVVDDSTIPG